MPIVVLGLVHAKRKLLADRMPVETLRLYVRGSGIVSHYEDDGDHA